MATKYQEASAKYGAKLEEVNRIVSDKPDYDWTEDEFKGWQDGQVELTVLRAEVDKFKDLDEQAQKVRSEIARQGKAVDSVGFSGEGDKPHKDAPEQKTLGQLVTEHAAFKEGHKTPGPRIAIEIPGVNLKTLMTTAAGFAPETARTRRVVLSALRRPMVADLIPQDTTSESSVKFMTETTHTNNAAFVAEGGTKGEAALAFTATTRQVETLAVWLPVTMQQLEDVDGMQALINNRLTLMLQHAEEVGLLTGDGNTPNLLGFYTAVTQAQAKGADPTPTAILKAFGLVQDTVGFADVTGIIMHPNDWISIATLQDTTGRYILGDPGGQEPNRYLWGVPVVVTPAATENTAILGDFQQYSHISRKMGIRIDISDSHSDFFIKNQLAIRAEERLSLEIYRITAFAEVTGI